MINIFKNESYLIGDKIKERFYEKYKNLELVIVYNDFNELVQGIDLQIIDKISKATRTVYISCYDFNTVSEFYNDSLIKIDKLLRSIIRKNYFK